MGGVVDNGQALHNPPIGRAIEDEVRGPDLVATLGAHQWLAVGYRDLLASTALQLEPGLRVQAIDPFVIDDVAGLPQLQIDHPGPIASMSLRQVNDPIPDDRIAIGPWHVPEGRRAHPPHGQGPALAGVQTAQCCRLERCQIDGEIVDDFSDFGGGNPCTFRILVFHCHA